MTEYLLDDFKTALAKYGEAVNDFCKALLRGEAGTEVRGGVKSKAMQSDAAKVG